MGWGDVAGEQEAEEGDEDGADEQARQGGYEEGAVEKAALRVRFHEEDVVGEDGGGGPMDAEVHGGVVGLAGAVVDASGMLGEGGAEDVGPAGGRAYSQ